MLIELLVIGHIPSTTYQSAMTPEVQIVGTALR
jgi:hypothetical protein